MQDEEKIDITGSGSTCASDRGYPIGRSPVMSNPICRLIEMHPLEGQ